MTGLGPSLWKLSDKRVSMVAVIARERGGRALSLQDLILTSSVSFTRKICSRRSCRSLNVDCAVIEYTRAKPWPFFMYKSLMAVNCSCKPAEGNIHDQEFYSSHFWVQTTVVTQQTYSTYCSGCVKDFKHTLLPIHLNLLRKGRKSQINTTNSGCTRKLPIFSKLTFL